MGHTFWRLLSRFLLFKAYIEMSVSNNCHAGAYDLSCA